MIIVFLISSLALVEVLAPNSFAVSSKEFNTVSKLSMMRFTAVCERDCELVGQSGPRAQYY